MSNYSNRIEFEDIKNQNIKKERIQDGFLSLEIRYFFKSYLTWSIYSSRYSEKKKKKVWRIDQSFKFRREINTIRRKTRFVHIFSPTLGHPFLFHRGVNILFPLHRKSFPTHTNITRLRIFTSTYSKMEK